MGEEKIHSQKKGLESTINSLSPVSLQTEWLALKWGTLILPFNPILSLFGLLFVLFSVWKKQYKRIIHSPLGWSFGLLSFWLILTTFLANDRGEAALGLANFLPYFGFFLACQLLFRSFFYLKQLAWVLVLASLPMILLGLGQIFAGWESPTFLKIIGSNLIAYGRPEGRMSSLLMYANLFSAYLVMILPLNLGLLTDFYRNWQRNKQTFPTWLLGLLAVTALSNAIAIFLTDSRSAWGVLFLIVLAFAFYWGWHWLIGISLGLASMVIWASWGPFGKELFRKIVPNYFWARLSDEMYPDRYVTAFRSTQWEFAWNMMLNRPFTGWGLRNFTPLYQAKMNVWLGHPHNFFVMLLGEIGIPGTLLFVGVVGWVLLNATRLLLLLSNQKKLQSKKPEHLLLFSFLIAFAALTFYNFSDVTIFDIRVNLIAWTVLAAIAGIVRRYQKLLPPLKFKM